MQGVKAESRQRKKYSSKVQMPTLIFKRRPPAVQIQQELSVTAPVAFTLETVWEGKVAALMEASWAVQKHLRLRRMREGRIKWGGTLMLYIREMRNLEKKKKKKKRIHGENGLCDRSNQQILWLPDPTCDKADEGSLHRNTLPTVTAFFFFFFFPSRAASRLAQPLPSPACDFHRQAVYRPLDSLWETFSFFFHSSEISLRQPHMRKRCLPCI